MNKKEDWAEDVLNVLEKVKRVEPNPELFDRISSNLFEKKYIKIIPLKRIKWVAAAACLFIGINAYVFVSNIKSNQNTITKTDDTNDLLSDYALYN